MSCIKIGNDWDHVLKEDFNSDYFKNLMNEVKKEYLQNIVYPKQEYIFKALELTSYEDVKVVILGQDPYHGENEAHGLSFSVLEGVKVPPSLKNIFKELKDDLKIENNSKGDLTSWAKEGVLLLNASLTVIRNKPNSHKHLNWNIFTDNIIKKLNDKESPVVFILWGNFAKTKKKYITNKRHLVLESTHPSPFSAYQGFLGSKPFSKTNEFLIKNKLKPINWKL